MSRELKSHFKSDLEKEQKLSALLDSYYKKHLKHYGFKRVYDIERQRSGADVILKRKSNGKVYFVDEKAQLDYINDDLPTFAFELSYLKKGVLKKGWLYDTSKKTEFYALITAIYSDAPGLYTSCKITMVNRKKLIALLASRKLNSESFESRDLKQGRIIIPELNSRTEGYVYFTKLKKAEKPLNLILKLDFLLEKGIAKRLI